MLPAGVDSARRKVCHKRAADADMQFKKVRVNTLRTILYGADWS